MVNPEHLIYELFFVVLTCFEDLIVNVSITGIGFVLTPLCWNNVSSRSIKIDLIIHMDPAACDVWQHEP